MNKKLYAEDWLQTRFTVLNRDGNKCVICGLPNFGFAQIIKKGVWQEISRDQYNSYKKEGLLVTRVYIQVAHKDQNKMNNDLSNLVSLCIPHHAKIDAPFKKFLRLKSK